MRRTFSLTACLVLVARSAESAAMNHPCSVGGGEGGGGAEGGVTGWLLNTQSQLTHHMSGKLHALGTDRMAFWGLIGIAAAYGVFHAAGPGHGKAVIASYMMASDRAVKRGAALALLAALLQGVVAVALVGIAALDFRATAAQMNRVADALAMASYAGIAAIGAWLVARKGRALWTAAKSYFASRSLTANGLLFAGAPWRPAPASLGAASYRAAAPEVSGPIDAECGHEHAPDPRTLGEGFSWRGAAATVIAAGSRPCSGAILVLVFSLAQGVFLAGIAATFAMSVGTAITTGALAFAAVYAKGLALRFAAGENSRVTLIARGFEFAAALLVLAFGLALLLAANGGA